MSAIPHRELLIRLFLTLRADGFALGLSELLAALRAAEQGWGSSDVDELRRMTRMLWCAEREFEATFEMFWSAAAEHYNPPPVLHPSDEAPPSFVEPVSGPVAIDLPPPQTALDPSPAPALTALPIYVPGQREARIDLQMYWPVSRRAMMYSLRRLRRLVADGPKDVLDLPATVERAVLQGFYLAPVYRRRSRNVAHLVMLVDQEGSMMPFHHLTRALVETAVMDSDLAQGKVEVRYFNNQPGERIYNDPHMIDSESLADLLARMTANTGVLVVSDAGAARGHLRLERIRATTALLSRFRQHTALIAWLNPMPTHRWEGTSAGVIAHIVPSFQMDSDGLSGAIDVLRGQPPTQYEAL